MRTQHTFEWTSPSSDPNDETFGDVIERTDLDSAGTYGAVLLGVPYDGAVLGRKGAHAGPAVIREALAGTKTHHFERGPVGSVGDLGDAQLPRDRGVSGVQERLEELTAELHETAALPVFVGGDNSLSVPNCAPLLDRGSVAAISIDAHLDCRALDDGPSSGTPYRQLHERGLDAFAVVGARHFETSTAYAEYVQERGGTIVTAEAVGADLPAAVDRILDAVAGVDHVFLSLDVDALDGAAAPGVSAPTPGGLSSSETFRLLAELASHDRLAGFEVVECAPPLDGTGQPPEKTGRTSRIAARAVAHTLAATGHTPTGGRTDD
jgi:formimidoylglutamase